MLLFWDRNLHPASWWNSENLRAETRPAKGETYKKKIVNLPIEKAEHQVKNT
ncbi:MAG: hypothetical protein JNM36_09560 [Chitinophagales bacterium]|jgi:hypothetical protein|nr:hypothetical protein [Chitinophagales bacterium]